MSTLRPHQKVCIKPDAIITWSSIFIHTMLILHFCPPWVVFVFMECCMVIVWSMNKEWEKVHKETS